MFRNNSKRFNNSICIICLVFCIIFVNVTPAFATQYQVVDAPANQKLQNIYNILYTTYAEITAQTDHLRAIKVALQSGGDTYNIISAVGGQVADVSSKLLTTNNYLSSINANQKDYTSYIDGIENEISNINWINIVDGRFCDTQLNTITNTTQITSSNYNQYLYNYNMPLSNNYGVIKFTLPVNVNNRTQNDTYEFLFYDINSQNVLSQLDPKYTYTYNTVNYNLELYVTDFYFNYRNIGIMIKPSRSFYYPANSIPKSYYVNNNSEDFIKVSEYIFLKNYNDDISSINSNIQKLTDIYASDDVIQAKQNQQNFETQAITNFTGNGNNSASLNDLGSISNISSTVKNGLNAGGSISGGLSVFNANNSDFWGWFSQSNYNEINGVQNRRLLTNNEYYDYVSDNQRELKSMLNRYE